MKKIVCVCVCVCVWGGGKKLRKQRQVDAGEALCCVHPGCISMAVNMADLTNHACLKSQCQFCGQFFHHRETAGVVQLSERELI